jgi:hypothetical protein
MKSLGESFGFEILLTVLLPGLAVFLGLLAVEPNMQRSMRASFPGVAAFLSGDVAFRGAGDTMADADTSPSSPPAHAEKDREWIPIFVVLALVSLLGGTVAALNGFFETICYDRVTPMLLGIDSDTFLSHWDEYLYRLGKESNSYVDRIVAWFLFESRMAVAIGGVVLFGLVFGEITSDLVKYLGVAFIAFAVVAMMHHYELGKYRLTRSADWRAQRIAEVAVAQRQTADAANARGIAERLSDVERQLRRLRRSRRRPPRPHAFNAST